MTLFRRVAHAHQSEIHRESGRSCLCGVSIIPTENSFWRNAIGMEAAEEQSSCWQLELLLTISNDPLFTNIHLFL
jgi:hypothetical protein